MVMLVAGSAVAQPVDQTGTGGGPVNTAKAPYTTATGATVPRPGTLDETQIIDEQTKDDRLDDKITREICIGCLPN